MIVEIFDRNPSKYCKLMETKFGDDVIEFLAREINEKCKESFEDIFNRILNISLESTSYLDEAIEKLLTDLKEKQKDIEDCLKTIGLVLNKLDDKIKIKIDNLLYFIKEFKYIALKRYVVSSYSKSRYYKYTKIFLNIIRRSFYALEIHSVNV